jgi:hypothetical protein
MRATLFVVVEAAHGVSRLISIQFFTYQVSRVVGWWFKQFYSSMHILP